ncbi:UDP-N-acetylglucosamine 2-epimerase (non-hydrolyzing) [Candidatus Bathyarchaeota archaeon]|nr:UDP-N-acetylglucosamine 2-epimerase (non-hydrolyzing) [Candidatus Bathyarchaeota archaeon]
MKAAIVLGTRPEIIKMTPVIREVEKRHIEFYILHTGQHYSTNMDKVFFEQLKLPEPRYNLKVGSGSHAEETGRILKGVEKILLNERPDIVLVEGDTNSVLAGALAAVKLRISVGHVEAGLRSHDRGMPEEINRIVADHISDYLFAPTEKARQNLLREGLNDEKIFVTGNTIVDAVYQNLYLSENLDDILNDLGLKEGAYFLATVHRQENVDNKTRFTRILEGLRLVQKYFNMPVVYPIHPRAMRRLREYGLDAEGITLMEPIDYLSFLRLESRARLIFTDSGGVQEEACILKVPCVTLRYNTERPESLEVRANILAGTEPRSILEKAKLMINAERCWPNPFGDGRAAERIVEVIEEKIASKR